VDGRSDSDVRIALDSPLEAGYSMPAEWAPHVRCWMAWPDRRDLWGKRLPDTKRDYSNVARAIARFEPVSMIVNPESAEEARRACGDEIDLLPLTIDDAWVRDSGPSFLRHPDGRIAATSWRFNAWGGKSPRYREDAMLSARLLHHVEAPLYHSSLALEGGGLHVDGEGTVLTTESVVLNPNRNPGIDKAEAERELCRALGAEKVIWLPGDDDPDSGDVTDGHVDGFACFARPGVVLYTAARDRQSPNAPVFEENRKALEAATDARGRKLELIPLYEAPTEERAEYCGYVNFYIANGGIVIPRFDIPSDDPARETLAKAFPDRSVVQVGIDDIAPGGGGIHCITQQQPA
jgi:agmatine deiminase